MGNLHILQTECSYGAKANLAIPAERTLNNTKPTKLRRSIPFVDPTNTKTRSSGRSDLLQKHTNKTKSTHRRKTTYQFAHLPSTRLYIIYTTGKNTKYFHTLQKILQNYDFLKIKSRSAIFYEKSFHYSALPHHIQMS